MAATGTSARPWPATGCSSFAWKRESKFITATPSSGNSISHSSARRSSSTGVREKFHNKTVKDVPRHFVNHVPGLDSPGGRVLYSSQTVGTIHHRQSLSRKIHSPHAPGTEALSAIPKPSLPDFQLLSPSS